jgi:hypothetical protein
VLWSGLFQSRFHENYVYEGVREGLSALRAAGVRSAVALWGGQPAATLLAEEPDLAFSTFADFTA